MRIFIFGPLKDIFSSEAVELDLDPPMTVAQLMNRLCGEHSNIAKLLRRCRIAVNGEYVDDDWLISEGDEIALIPPVSGGLEGMMSMASGWHCNLTDIPINLSEVIAQAIDAGVGAVALFIGVVRGHSGGREVIALEYEAYEAMAREKLDEIARGLLHSYRLKKLIIIHRIGKANVGEVVVAIAASSEHRHEAIEACREAIERLKRDVPIWKKEVFVDGWEWVMPEDGQS